MDHRRRRRRRRHDWAPQLAGVDRPLYLALVDRLAADIRADVLLPGTRLPTHRELAQRLGIDVSTVSRAYGEARRRGLVAGRVGRGTFVRGIPSGQAPGLARPVDLTTNTPPEDNPVVRRLVVRIFRAFGRAGDEAPAGYAPIGGATDDRLAASEWLAHHGLSARADRVLVAACAQQAFVAILAAHCSPGDMVVTESVTYPGFAAAADLLRLRLVGADCDAGGIDPGSVERLCRWNRPKALIVVPTLHNPTGVTLSAGRRSRLATVARRHGLVIVEDDAYGPLHERPPRPIADIAPDVTYLVATASKVLLPMMRWCAIAAPTRGLAQRVESALRATGWMQSAFDSLLARRILTSGAAVAVLASRRKEAADRMALAARILGPSIVPAQRFGHHLWLELPRRWRVRDFVEELRRQQVLVSGGELFVVNPASHAHAVRVCLGAAPITLLKRALEQIATTLQGEPASRAPSH
jgi:DNA-binding transcriptional MocR family regulator